ncbi:hypothetical protein CF319_g2402 [Tilletia indica]|nr:hypothetical protein CF319_g2402 [Tilletia indica]
MRISLVAVGGASSSSCGYCSPPGQLAKIKTSRSFYLFSYALDPEAYQYLIDAGWRRSGEVLYKPDNSRTCCPQHTIRLPVESFKTSRSQRRALKPLFWEIHAPEDGNRPMKKRGNDNEPFDLESFWLNTEWNPKDELRNAGGVDEIAVGNSWYRFQRRRKLEITLRPASHTEEKFQLWNRYQIAVHKDAPGSNTHNSWKRFLVNNSFHTQQDINDRGPVDLSSDDAIPYGGYHQEWRLDGELIAVGVLDILPSCVSSVYLFYEPKYEHLNLGKASALREIHLVSQLQRKRGMQELRYYYLGFWIANCQKMVYKADFRPQMVLDTATNQWHPMSEVKSAIESGIHFDFLSPHTSDKGCDSSTSAASESIEEGTDSADDDSDEEGFSTELQKPLPPGYQDHDTITASDLNSTNVLIQSDLFGSRIVPFGTSDLTTDPEMITKLKTAKSALDGISELFAFVP